MKYRYLSIILLILIFSVGAVCAQDNAADIISAGSDDVISIEEAPVLQDNGSSADEIHINDANFNQYFDESGTMNDNVSADSTIFIGEITNKSLYINKPVDIVPDDTSKITDSIITLISGSDGSTINGLTFNNNIIGAVEIDNAIDVAVIGNIINIVSNSNITHPAISALYANNLNVTANTITYNGKSDGENAVVAMVITESENAVIEDNEFTINIPSNIIDWIETPPGSWNYVANPRSVGIMVTNSNELSFKRNEIYLNATDVFGSDDTIYVVDIVDSDNVQFDENNIVALGHNYIYGLVISGEYFDVIGNSISILSDTNYANGIDIEGGSSGVVEDNDLYIIAPNVAYPVYSAMNWGTMESPDVDYLYNYILSYSDVVYGMHLTGTDSIISGNTISIHGNYTMGIYSLMMEDLVYIHNNEINVHGLKNDTKSTADMIPAQTVGILATSESEIHNNIIESDGNYTIVSTSSDSEIKDNYLIASELVGDESVDDRSDEAIVENNIPNSENKYNLTNDTFFLYFDEDGDLREGITGELTFIGEFSNLVKEIFIFNPISLKSDNATLYNMGIEILSPDVAVDGFNFVSDSLNEIICVEDASMVYIINSNFTVAGLDDEDNDVIHIVDSEDVYIINNRINFAVETNETYKNTAIRAIDSDNVKISNNTITALLPSRSIDWTSGEVYSEVVSLDGCNDAILADNVILVKSNGNIGEYDTIYAVHVTGDDALVVRNSIGVAEAPYGYGLVIAGEDFIIADNLIAAAAQNETYSCGIDVESNSNGIIDSNFIIAYGESAYGIYTADWAGDVKVNITNNEIVTNGTNVFGMSLSGSEATVDNNTIYADGNFTTGIASTVDMIFVTNNTITANGTNEGAPTSYDSMGIETIGVHIVDGDALVKDNTINANSKYAVSVEGTGAVTDNEIYADMLTGDFAVDYVQNSGVLVVNNTPAMELTYKLTNDTFYVYFDEEGELREQIDADNLTFIGPFSNLVDAIFIENPITLLSDNATLNDISILVGSENVTIDGFNFINNNPASILAFESDNLIIMNNNFDVTADSELSCAPIFIADSDGVRIYNNNVDLVVVSNETFNYKGIYAVDSDDIVLADNTVKASLPAGPVNWTTGEVNSEGVSLNNCNDGLLDNNTIIVYSNDEIGDYATIYAVHVTGDDAEIVNNQIIVSDAPYGYGLVIAGEDIIIYSNFIIAGGNESYACGIDVESNSDVEINNNTIVAVGDSAYGIYTADWAGDVKADITDNTVIASGVSVFGMSLSGSESTVDHNIIYALGNFTTGIASTMDMIFITNNTIAANGTNVGTPAGYDTMGIETIGVHIVDGDALVKYNNITSNSEYTVSVEGTGAVTDNNLIAINYTGDASVDSIPGDTLVANNTPAMQRAIVTADDVVLYYKNGTRYVILLTDQNGNALPNETVTITINGVPYDRTTDEKGIASIAINLPSGNYTASVLYVGKGDFTNTTSENNVTVLSTIYGDDLVKVFRNGTQYYATFVDGQGNPLAHGTDVTFNINGVFYTRQINGTEGKAKLNINLEQGEYIITAYHPVSGEMHSNIITVLPLIQSNDLVKYFRNESQFVVTVFGADGNPVGAGEDVTFNINGVFYTRQTNESGQAKLNINLEQGNYTITTMYNGCNVANNIEVLPILYAQDLIMKQGTSDQFRAKLFDGQGNPYPGQNITFNIHGIFYQRTTDSDGWAALNIKLSAVADTYIITSMYNGCTISNKIVIEPA